MSDGTGIAWTDATANAVVGCSRVSSGCTRCYAERLAATRLKHTPRYKGLAVVRANGEPQWTGSARLVPAALDQILRWKRPRRIFLTAMGDPFHESLTDTDIAALFGVVASAPQHTFQVLTKRPERAKTWFAWVGHDAAPIRTCLHHALVALTRLGPVAHWGERALLAPDQWPLPNVHLGVSIEDQATADERIPLLMTLPAAVRWVSLEPQLADVNLRDYLERWHCSACDDAMSDCEAEWRWNGEGWEHKCPGTHPQAGTFPARRVGGLDWVVQGGESGPGARPFDLAWMRRVREQCWESGTPFFAKQMGDNPRCGACGDTGTVAGPHGEGDVACSMCGGDKGLARLRATHHGADPAAWPRWAQVQQFPHKEAR